MAENHVAIATTAFVEIPTDIVWLGWSYETQSYQYRYLFNRLVMRISFSADQVRSLFPGLENPDVPADSEVKQVLDPIVRQALGRWDEFEIKDAG